MNLAALEYLYLVQREETNEYITYRDIYYKNYGAAENDDAISLCTGLPHKVVEE